MTASFSGKVALVTGAGSGIGRETALAFSTAGASVLVSDINEEGGRETVERMQENGGDSLFFCADVTNPEDVAGMVQTAVNSFGRLDIAVNNAGIGGGWTRVADYQLADWDRVLAVNLTSVFYCLHYEINQMLKQGSGIIVNISSVAGLRGLAHSAAYSASKHGVIGLTKSAALEVARNNIRINAVCPAFTRTPLFESLFSVNPTYEERILRNIPMRRYGRPEDIAAAILWLCSEDAAFVTGQALPLDGGLTAG